MEQDKNSPPTFFFQPPITNPRRRRSPSPVVDPVFLIIFLPIVILFVIFFLLPPFISQTSNFLNKPTPVKSTWDIVIVLLVVFAVLCGIFGKKNEDLSPTGNVNNVSSMKVSTYDPPAVEPVVGSNRLTRSSSSYPDLRQESLWEAREERLRFYDDYNVNLYSKTTPSRRLHRRSRELEDVNLYSKKRPSSQKLHRRSLEKERDERDSPVKEIPVDTFVVQSNYENTIFPSPLQKLPTPPPPPPPPRPQNAEKPKERHSFRSVGRKVHNHTDPDHNEIREPPPPPPPPPPFKKNKLKKLDQKVSGATKEIASAITSLYKQTKKKNRQKSKNVYENVTSSDSSPSPTHSIPPPPPPPTHSIPPPPPPPPPSVFHNMFKKRNKHKRLSSGSIPPPPPPPPLMRPSNSIFNMFPSKSKRFSPSSTQPPPPPPPPPPTSHSIFNNMFTSKSKRFNAYSTQLPSPPSSHGKSKRFSSNSIPAPPPPPSSILNNIFKTGTKSKRHNPTAIPPPQIPPPRKSTWRSTPTTSPTAISETVQRRHSTTGKPPRPSQVKSYSFYESENYFTGGGQSPLIPVPPPPPPFKMADIKFEVRGDYVSLRSAHSSVCGSPDRGDVDLMDEIMDGRDSTTVKDDVDGPKDDVDIVGPMFLPSPDVNVKADNFISRLKDEWKLDKVNSVKGRFKSDLDVT